jgi:transposase
VLDDYVCVDNRFRFIDAFVDCLDLVEAGFARVQSMATARPGYAPGDLLELYVYGYLNRQPAASLPVPRDAPSALLGMGPRGRFAPP